MDQQNFGPSPGELPKPLAIDAFPVEQTGALPLPESTAAASVELKPVAASPVSPPLQAVPLQPVSVSAPLTQAVPDQSVPTPSVQTPGIADDADLIEKEWVVKAKEIVQRTKNDPHLQNQEMTHFKADYQKKRYNRDVKVGQE